MNIELTEWQEGATCEGFNMVVCRLQI